MTGHRARVSCSRAAAEAAIAIDEPFAGIEPAPVLVAAETEAGWELQLYTDAPPDAALLARLEALAGAAPEVEAVPEADWVTLSQAGLRPVEAGRFHVSPDAASSAKPGRLVLKIGAGLAFAHKYREDLLGEEGGVCLTYFGDGAANQGQVYEAFNMAELWKLPVVFVIENNQYAMGTSVNRASAEDQLYRRGESFRIEGLQVDGMDVLAVRGAATLAVEWARTRGPILLEMKTYRYRGHSMSDPAKYRTRDEVSAVREQQDPIDRAAKEIVALGFATEADLKGIEREVRAEVTEAADFAEQAPEPELAELFTDVLAGEG
ncbi:MAG: thiamine pyrophosphate-dependent enzyme [Thermaurantiacus tibetensis]